MLSSIIARRRLSLASVKFLSRLLTALNLLLSIATKACANRSSWRHISMNCRHTLRTADPFWWRKLAIVLKSGFRFWVSHIDDLRAKTHRGLCGQIERGFHAGGLAYGYRSVALDGGHRLEVDPAQAEQVRWIFARYAGGWSCQKIAATLNAQGVRGPRGGTWCVSA